MAFKRKFMRRKASKRTFKRKSFASKRAPLKKLIRREIARNTENKMAQYYAANEFLNGVVSTSFAVTNTFPLGPASAFSPIINQGVGQSSRIGNRIKTKKLMLKGTITPVAYDATNNPIPVPMMVKVWIYYDKTDPIDEPDPKGSADFFQLGGASKGFANDLTDMWAPVNTDRYRVLTTRSYKVGYAGYNGAPVSAPYVNQQFFNNNDFPMSQNFSIDCTKFYPKDVRFNDNNSLPTSRGLFMTWHFVGANGLPIGAASQMLRLQYMQDYVFEDA